MSGPLFLGLDFGTSGCRANLIDDRGQLQAEAGTAYSAQNSQGPQEWQTALDQVLRTLLTQVDPRRIKAIAVDGTSGSVLLADAQGSPCSPVLMYNDNRARGEAETIARLAPEESAAHGAGSGLAKLLWLQNQGYLPGASYALNQTDWINGLLSGHFGISDENNALKMGYDPIAMAWPAWIETVGFPLTLLPQVQQPGLPISTLSPVLGEVFGFEPDTLLCSGTTDSTAAIIATGASEPGEGISSLGSTLVTKVVCEQPIFDRQSGVYSQPYGDRWLAGGGSNSGGAVLRQFFSDAQMTELSPRLNPQQGTGLDYYPLPATGERFPINDAQLEPRITPRPKEDAVFFQGLLEGIATVEKMAYDKLQDLGTPKLCRVYTTGGGRHNSAWRQIRERLLGVPVLVSDADAAYGSALLARHGWYSAQ